MINPPKNIATSRSPAMVGSLDDAVPSNNHKQTSAITMRIRYEIRCSRFGKTTSSNRLMRSNENSAQKMGVSREMPIIGSNPLVECQTHQNLDHASEFTYRLQ